MKRAALAFLLFVLIGAVAGALYVRQRLTLPGPLPAGTNLIVEIPRGLPALQVVGLLEDQKVIPNRYSALAYMFYSGKYGKLQAGEYLFTGPVSTVQVVDRIASGSVYLHKFTVPEGFTLEQTAKLWQDGGFGTAEEFLMTATASMDLVRPIDEAAVSVEGYLFPETYSFPLHTSASQAIAAMVNRFREMLKRLNDAVPQSNWPLNLHDTVTLASLVESEAAHEDERPLIASVYFNRLRQNILLQCDPTVIYALTQAKQYRGSLTLTDLRFDSPYNTYVKAGLPPGPISNPGYPSLLAAVQPPATSYLFFVRTTEGRHTFSETLAAHNRAVAAYRKYVKSGAKK
jgi:UPF0755 protein